VNTNNLASFLIFVALGIAPAGVVNSAAEGALPTAKTGLAAAGAAARKWQPDATLVVVQTDTATPDGRAHMWMYLYDSPGSNQQAAVIVGEKGEVNLMPTSTAFKKPLGKFVDSDAAMAAAVAAGMKANDFGMKMSLKMSSRAEWFMSDSKYSFTIDAVSGKLLTKEE
jgi:hypothetical protein